MTSTGCGVRGGSSTNDAACARRRAGMVNGEQGELMASGKLKRSIISGGPRRGTGRRKMANFTPIPPPRRWCPSRVRPASRVPRQQVCETWQRETCAMRARGAVWEVPRAFHTSMASQVMKRPQCAAKTRRVFPVGMVRMLRRWLPPA